MVGQLARLDAEGTIIYRPAGTFLVPHEFGQLFKAISILGVGVLPARLVFPRFAARYIAGEQERGPSRTLHFLSVMLQ